MPSSPGRTPIISFGWLSILVLLVIAPPLIIYDNYKMWRWRKRK